jgi:hypothetical protein
MSTFTFTLLGQGIRGLSAVKTSNTTNEFSFSTEKKIVSKSFPTTSKSNGNFIMTNNFAQTPFRLAMNAGDPDLKIRGGPKSTRPPASGKSANFVYDSSDYTRFKKLQARNRNYNDSAL